MSLLTALATLGATLTILVFLGLVADRLEQWREHHEDDQ